MAAKKPTKQAAGTKKSVVKKVKPAKKPTAGKRAMKPALKTPKKAAAPLPSAITRVPGDKRYWLVKTEPDVFSFENLLSSPDRTTFWDGIRNYQARNYLRDSMRLGDRVLVYHSNAEPPAIAGIAEVVREGYPDHTQFDAMHHHFDPAARSENPTWYMVDIRAVQSLARILPLPELREVKELAGMMLLQKGSRLSIQPVTEAEWNVVMKLGGVA